MYGMKQDQPELPRSTPPTDGFQTVKGVGIASAIQQRAALVIGIIFLLAAGAMAIWNLYFSPEPPPNALYLEDGMPGGMSIAVLPFTSSSGDPGQEQIIGGFGESIAKALSAAPNFSVVVYDSEMTVDGRRADPPVTEGPPDTRYMVKGDYRKDGTGTQVTVFLIDAATGQTVWTEHYEQDRNDIVSFQKEIAEKVLTGLRMKFPAGASGMETEKAGARLR
jgi:TolB-like protein